MFSVYTASESYVVTPVIVAPLAMYEIDVLIVEVNWPEVLNSLVDPPPDQGESVPSNDTPVGVVSFADTDSLSRIVDENTPEVR